VFEDSFVDLLSPPCRFARIQRVQAEFSDSPAEGSGFSNDDSTSSGPSSEVSISPSKYFSLEAEIDDTVYDLFDLTEEEREVVEDYLDVF